ncbi:heavy metal-responsive transcriptional regulator [Spirulina major CS-329]|uniref:heavy metal-responsive transcriptional regulator n=1 Tax=Spirulina TaxID=1154 RepID=UPI0023312021|nr:MULTISPECIES: heavy metal-responsive transcriptional regulator [Spirulina]MDB9495876.1 heavy metal-responsive transcriptional regulator [Spirulina subsalsa CS-330]MDB9504688.1 heavy metal-responsive transcriptional regulator [Spirulina major CS-329]
MSTSRRSALGLKIGQVAQESGLSVKTIRFYTEADLLNPVMRRSPSGYRLFDPDVFNRLAFIKRSQALGLSLRDIHDLLMVHDGGTLPCGAIKERLQQKLDNIHAQIANLEILRLELEGILSGWEDQPPAHLIERTICPNLQQP